MARRTTYQELIGFVSTQGKVSYHRSNEVLKTLSRVIMYNLKKGNAIECDGICKIDFTIKEHININSVYFDASKQAMEVSDILQLPVETTESLIKLFYLKVKSDLEAGCEVHIKSIAYFTPTLDNEGNIYIAQRLSPQLSNYKPQVADFIVMTNSGDINIKEFEKDDLRFSLNIDENLRTPYSIATEDTYKPRYITI